MARRDDRDKQAQSDDAPERRRIDLWLFYARIVRTRSLAAELAESGHVRINGARNTSVGKGIKRGDVLTIALERDTRVLRVLELGERRGGYPEAQRLYEDLSQAPSGAG